MADDDQDVSMFTEDVWFPDDVIVNWEPDDKDIESVWYDE